MEHPERPWRAGPERTSKLDKATRSQPAPWARFGYPPATKSAEARLRHYATQQLRHYATQIPLVEIDSHQQLVQDDGTVLLFT